MIFTTRNVSNLKFCEQVSRKPLPSTRSCFLVITVSMFSVIWGYCQLLDPAVLHWQILLLRINSSFFISYVICSAPCNIRLRRNRLFPGSFLALSPSLSVHTLSPSPRAALLLSYEVLGAGSYALYILAISSS